MASRFSITQGRSISVLCLAISTFSGYNAMAGGHPSENTPLTLYLSINFGDHERPAYDVFERAVAGYYQLLYSHKLSQKGILTVIDFRKSGNDKRLWVIDLENMKLLYHTLVAHGRKSGELYADKFSNIPNSHQSSLGFYVTGNTYKGQHGISLHLKGVEPGINDQAEARSIVMHGADYVSYAFIRKAGRLGRSHGCPAIPMNVCKEMLPKLAGQTCLFIYYPDEDYLARTNLYNPSDLYKHLAAKHVEQQVTSSGG
jgi:L,D-transpeptidase catalytic domain